MGADPSYAAYLMETAGCFFSSDWFSHNIQHWTALLKDLTGRPDVQVLEIGSFEGLSANWLVENILTHPTARLTCVDPFPDMTLMPNVTLTGQEMQTNTFVKFHHNTQRFQHKLEVHRGYSYEVLRRLPFEHFDLIYIDGSHRSMDVLEDSILCLRLLKTGGVMVWDDYEWVPDAKPEDFLRHPKPGIDTFLQYFGSQFESLHKGYQVFVRKVSAHPDVRHWDAFNVSQPGESGINAN